MSSSNWSRLDNVAKVFLATHTKRDTRSLRVSCTLIEDIDPQLLAQALVQAAPLRPEFQVRIRRGIFWNYLESTDVLPVPELERERPCPILYGHGHKGVLHYKVTYYNNRINLDMFHAISDGTGALDYLNVIVATYLKLKYPDIPSDTSIPCTSSASERARNSFEQFYEGSDGKRPDNPKSYHLHGSRLPYDQLQFFEIHMPSTPIKELAKSQNISITSLLGANLMCAIYKDMPIFKRKMPITISLPVNLRNFFPSQTNRNFFNSINFSHVFKEGDTATLIAKEFDRGLKEGLNNENILHQMNAYQQLEHLLFVRMVPLAIKQPVVRYFSKRQNASISAVLSNLGVMKTPDELSPYIKGYSALCSHNELFITAISYKEELVLGVASGFSNTSTLKNFISSFTEHDIPVTVHATEVIRI